MTGRDIYEDITDAIMAKEILSDKLTQVTHGEPITLTNEEANQVLRICVKHIASIYQRNFE